VTIDLVKLSGKAVQGAVQVGLSFIPGGSALGKIVEELQKAGVENLSDEALDAIQRERTKIHIEQVRFLEQFQDRFHKIVAESVIRNQNGRLIIFIDDLDRCLPEKAIEILEAIKLFMDVPGCVFVLGLDQEVIARGVELRYKEFFKNGEQNPINGAKYLEKIIQLPFHIPPIEEQDMGIFVKSLVQDWPHPDCPKIFSETVSYNPRQVKRAVNSFLLLLRLAKERKIKATITHLRLAKIVAIQSILPELHEIFKLQPALLPKLEDYFKMQKDIETGREPKQKIELPSDLIPYGGNLSLSRILTMHSLNMRQANFSTLHPDDIKVYFTLAHRVEKPLREKELIKIPIAGLITASVPSPVPEKFSYYDADASVEILRSLLSSDTKNDDLFALEVKGDSLIDAMVNSGDIVIMKRISRSENVKNGEMVAVWLPERDETTLKYFYKEKDRYRLQPANPDMSPIFVSKNEKLEIRGKVVMVIRKV